MIDSTPPADMMIPPAILGEETALKVFRVLRTYISYLEAGRLRVYESAPNRMHRLRAGTGSLG